jgi:ribosomal protein S18 acetylase RimI-like enzyme
MIAATATKIQFGNEVGLAAVTEAFNLGFQDYRYGTVFSPEQMEVFLHRSQVALEDCAVLVADDGAQRPGPIGLALLGLQGASAWCGGLAVAPEARRLGGGRRLMQAIQQRAAAADAHEIWLEVLADNERAEALYQSLGYETVRLLEVWERQPATGHPVAEIAGEGLLRPVPVDQVLDRIFTLQPVRPAWQRSAPLVRSWRERLQALQLVDDAGLALGHLLWQPLPGDPTERGRIVALGVEAGAPGGTTEQLLAGFAVAHDGIAVSLLNEPAGSIWSPALAATGFAVIERQHEMRLGLG